MDFPIKTSIYSGCSMAKSPDIDGVFLGVSPAGQARETAGAGTSTPQLGHAETGEFS